MEFPGLYFSSAWAIRCSLPLAGLDVEAEEVQEYLNMQYGRKLQEGSTVTTKSMECDHYTCPNIERCNMTFMREGSKATITKIEEKLDCPKGYNMRKVAVKMR